MFPITNFGVNFSDELELELVKKMVGIGMVI